VSNRPRSKQSKAAGPRTRPPGPRGGVTPRSGTSRRPGASARGAQPEASTPTATGFRRKVERASYPFVLRLHRMPRWLVTVALAALLVAGLLAPSPYGPVCLGVVVALMAWLTYLAWHQGDRGRRVIRVVALALGCAALILRIAAT
jgi:uncharacterized protein DUF6703